MNILTILVFSNALIILRIGNMKSKCLIDYKLADAEPGVENFWEANRKSLV